MKLDSLYVSFMIFQIIHWGGNQYGEGLYKALTLDFTIGGVAMILENTFQTNN